MAYARWIGAIAGFLIWLVVVQPILTGNFVMSLEWRLLLSFGSLLALLLGGLLLGHVVGRYIRRGRRLADE